MDAASHTGVDDVREIIEAVRYASVSARYKIYIIDEVHMLSKNAFNALLKTLEEPPEHVKFLFATTEVDKVPVTVLSRCQRFDLRRIPAEKLAAHFADVAEKEGVEVEDEALRMIARAAEGSARDGLSILDQAIAHGDGTVTRRAGPRHARAGRPRAHPADARACSVGRCGGDADADLDEAHDAGHRPGVAASRADGGVARSLPGPRPARPATCCNRPRSARRPTTGRTARLGPIHRLWQMLLKGLHDVQIAPDPHEAAAMALLRLIHAADLPDPASAARAARRGAGRRLRPQPARRRPRPSSRTDAGLPSDFAGLVELLEKSGKHRWRVQLHDQVGLVRYAPPDLVLKPLRPLGATGRANSPRR